MSLIILLILVLLLVGSFPTWPHSKNWGYRPSGALGIVALVLIVLLITGHM